MAYASKLDEFEMFVSRAKYPSLCFLTSSHQDIQHTLPSTILKGHRYPDSSSFHVKEDRSLPTHQTPSSRRPKLLVIDDLPHVNDAEARRRLSSALRDLVLTARGPVVIVTTEASSASNSAASGSSVASGPAKGLHKVGVAHLGN